MYYLKQDDDDIPLDITIEIEKIDDDDIPIELTEELKRQITAVLDKRHATLFETPTEIL
jgi:hypothetical protein